MSTTQKVGVGLLLLVIGGAAGAFLAKGQTSSNEDVGSFLRRVGPTFQKASDACFAAEQCGSLERDPKRGALASADEMPRCLEERLPTCSALVEQLSTFIPPREIAPLWEGARQFRTSRALKHALITSQLVVDSNGPPAITIPPGKAYAEVEGWVTRQHLPIAAKYAELRNEAEKWQQDIMALDEWIRVHNLCATPNVRCTIDRAMEGR